jgi:hypothetical protein
MDKNKLKCKNKLIKKCLSLTPKFESMYKDIVISLANELCPHKKKPMYTNEYCYDAICTVLHSCNSWKDLQLHSHFENKSENHFDTIRKRFNMWNDQYIFETAYYQLLNSSGFPKTFFSLRKPRLYIDTAKFNNKNGHELIGFNTQYMKKKITKISIVSTSSAASNIPLLALPVVATVYDGKTIKASIKYIKNEFNIKEEKHLILVGDGGYLLKPEEIKKLKDEHHITLIVPRRRNMKTQNTYYEKTILKDRHCVENCIQKIKRCDRVMTRKDRLLKNFMGFVHLSMGISVMHRLFRE